ncbi:MAG: carboxypeptidase-like regulatory domain-containing protein, partial [Parafilimonas sp.]
MKNLFIAAFLFLSLRGFSQTNVSGHIKDNRGKPVSGVSVTLKGTYDGALSDSAGDFNFITKDTGSHVIEITNVNYDDYQTTIELNNTPVTVNASLKEKFNQLKAVIVTAGSFEAGDNKRAATVLSSIDVATTAGSNADITAALKTLPGAQLIGNQDGLFVRGGTGEETKQFIDGTLVNNPYYTSVPDIATRGRFSP